MCLTCQTQIDPEQMNAFGDRLLNLMNESALGLMISIGYRTGLFETMKRLSHPSSVRAVAEAADLNERYVREWLGAMTTGGIVESDADGERFHLPPSHAAMLTSGGEGDCFAHLTQYLAILGRVEDSIVKCFREGGGVPYSEYPRFHEVMAEDSRQSVVDALFEHLLPLDPGLRPALERGVRVLDVGCGQGYALRRLAEAFPRSQFVGYDLSEEATSFAQKEAIAHGLENIRFEARDLTRFDRDAQAGAFDLVFAFDAIHDQARPDRVLAGIRRTLRPEGLFFMQDIGASSNIARNRDHAIGPLLYTISCMHCMTVSLAQGGLGLGAMWGEEMTRQFLENAGFTAIDRKTLPHDVQNYYYLVR